VGLGSAEGEVGGGSFFEVVPDADVAGGVGAGEGFEEWGVSGTGADDEFGDACFEAGFDC
jgi:hypothetical protein